MYRTPSGKISHSFTRFMNNAAPSFMQDSTADPGHISLPQKDSVYLHQLTLSFPGFYAITPSSLISSLIIDHEGVARKVFRSLQKSGVLSSSEATSTPEGEGGVVDTTKIGPKFTHELAVITAVRQKQLIDLLFWWEEECQRMRKLRAELVELEELVEHARRNGDGGEMERFGRLIQRVTAKISARPSLRDESVERDEDLMAGPEGHQLGVGGESGSHHQRLAEEVDGAPPPAYSG